MVEAGVFGSISSAEGVLDITDANKPLCSQMSESRFGGGDAKRITDSKFLPISETRERSVE
jgi:hypothetical protein